MKRFVDKIVIITGAATGIGFAAAEEFAREGAIVIATDIDGSALATALAPLRAEGLRIEGMAQDVTQEPLWQRLFDDVIGRHGRVDVLVNNAGIGVFADAETSTVAEWRRVMSINLEAVFVGQRTAIRAMKARGGVIVNVASIAANVGEPLLAAYNASKGGVALLTKAGALHCARAGYPIRINSLHPGYTVTRLVTDAIASLPEAEGKIFEAGVIAKIPMARMAQVREIARPLLFLASDDASYVTGAELVVDGGYLAE